MAEQVPQKLVPAAAVTENSIVLAWQLGNLYLLMAFVGLFVLNSTSEVKVVRSYLWALWLGDIGHVAFSCYGLGKERMMNPSEWNGMAWGNIVFTVSTCLFPITATALPFVICSNFLCRYYTHAPETKKSCKMLRSAIIHEASILLFTTPSPPLLQPPMLTRVVYPHRSGCSRCVLPTFSASLVEISQPLSPPIRSPLKRF